jgi:hypothetical protein
MNRPDQLLAQLVARTHSFKNQTGLTSRQICQLTDINEQHLCDFLAGRKGLSLTSTVRLLEIFGLNKTELEAKLRSPRKIMIEHFQSLDGKPLKLDGGNWTPGQQGRDPNDGGNIDGDGSDAGDLGTEDFLRKQIEIHRSAIAAISDYLVKGKVNKTGSTRPARTVSDPRTPGAKGDAFRVSPAQMLAHLEREREQAETELAIQKKINEERKKRLAAQMELAQVRKESLFSTK